MFHTLEFTQNGTENEKHPVSNTYASLDAQHGMYPEQLSSDLSQKQSASIPATEERKTQYLHVWLFLGVTISNLNANTCAQKQILVRTGERERSTRSSQLCRR